RPSQRGWSAQAALPHDHPRVHQRLASARDEPGDDRVEGPLARTNLVGMAGRKDKAVSAVLHGDARTWNDDAAAETRVVGLDQRDHSALVIGGGEINGPALL